MRKCREWIAPFLHSLSISSPFFHSLSIFLQPGCQDATICATLIDRRETNKNKCAVDAQADKGCQPCFNNWHHPKKRRTDLSSSWPNNSIRLAASHLRQISDRAALIKRSCSAVFRSARTSCTTSENPYVCKKNLDHLYTCIHALWIIRSLIKPTRHLSSIVSR